MAFPWKSEREEDVEQFTKTNLRACPEMNIHGSYISYGLDLVTYNELPFFERDAMIGTHEHEIVWFILRRILGLGRNTVATF